MLSGTKHGDHKMLSYFKPKLNPTAKFPALDVLMNCTQWQNMEYWEIVISEKALV